MKSTMHTVALGIRLSRGAGKAGWLRLALMFLGTAIGVVAILQIWAMPQVLTTQANKVTQRIPVSPAIESGIKFYSTTVKIPWHNRQIHRVFIAGGRKDAPAAPGIPRLPRPGEVFISPALSTVVAENSDLRPLVPGRIVGHIKAAGLEDPDDLYAYIGLTTQQLARHSEPDFDFGNPDYVLENRPTGSIVIELLLLIGGPTAIYLVTCSRLSATVRTRRFASLRLLGMGRRQLLTIAGIEGGFAAFIGGLLGLALFHVVTTPLAHSGIFGFRWYPEDVHIGLPVSIGVLLLVSIVGWLVGVAGTRRALNRPLWTHARSVLTKPSWLWVLPLVIGIGLLLPVVWILATGHQFSQSPVLNAVVIVGGTVAIIGALLALRPLLAWSADRLACSSERLPIQLAGRRLQYESAGNLRIISGLMLLMFVSGIGTAVLRDADLAAETGNDANHLTVEASSFAAQYRDSAFQAPARARVASIPQFIKNEDMDINSRKPTVTAAFANCADLAAFVGRTVTDCHNGHAYRLIDNEGGVDDASALISGSSFAVGTANEHWNMTIPKESLSIPNLWSGGLSSNTVLITSDTSPPGGWPANTSFDYVAANPQGLVSLAAHLSTMDPAVQLQQPDAHTELQDAIRLHKSAIMLGLFLGFGLGVAAFLIAAIDTAYERRASITALAVVGIPRRTLQLTQCVQLGLPLLLGLSLSLLVGQLGGMAFLSLGGLQNGLYFHGFKSAISLLALALLLACASAMIVVGNRPRAEQLRRE